MDELKLEKWKRNFNMKVEKIRIEFDEYFKNKKPDDYYTLKLNESSGLIVELYDALLTDGISPSDIIFIKAD